MRKFYFDSSLNNDTREYIVLYCMKSGNSCETWQSGADDVNEANGAWLLNCDCVVIN